MRRELVQHFRNVPEPMKRFIYRSIALGTGAISPLFAHAQPVIGGWTNEAFSGSSALGGGLDYNPAPRGSSSSFNTGLDFTSSGSGARGTNFGPVGELPNPLGISTLGDLVDKVSNVLIILAVPVVTGMIMWGAFKIASAGSDPKQVSEGGKIIKNAAIGFALLLLASGMTQVIQSLFS